MKFDVIYHSDVISHLHDPHAAYSMMHEKLNNNGIVIFETGNLSDVHKRYYPLFSSFQYPDHLFFFGEDTIKKLLRTHQFNFKKIYRYSIIVHLMILKLLSRNAKNKEDSALDVHTPPLIKSGAIKRAIKNTYHLVLYFVRYKLGALLPKKNRPQTIIVVAQKNC
jgi:SAM-dependent methyltransferase